MEWSGRGAVLYTARSFFPQHDVLTSVSTYKADSPILPTVQASSYHLCEGGKGNGCVYDQRSAEVEKERPINHPE